MIYYVDVIKADPIQGRKWIVVLKSCYSGHIAMKGLMHYRYKKDAAPLKKTLEEALKSKG